MFYKEIQVILHRKQDFKHQNLAEMKSHQFILVSLELQGDFSIKGQKTHRRLRPSTQSLKENRVASPAERLGTWD